MMMLVDIKKPNRVSRLDVIWPAGGNFFKFPVLLVTKKKKMADEAEWWYLL
jgi:hypothetical protein